MRLKDIINVDRHNQDIICERKGGGDFLPTDISYVNRILSQMCHIKPPHKLYRISMKSCHSEINRKFIIKELQITWTRMLYFVSVNKFSPAEIVFNRFE